MRALVKEPFAPHDLPAGVEGFKLDQTRIRYTDEAGRTVVVRLNSSNRIYVLEGDALLIETFATRADTHASDLDDCNGLTLATGSHSQANEASEFRV